MGGPYLSCPICSHPKRAEVEAAVKSGELTITKAAKMFGADYTTTWRHFKECLKEPIENREFEDNLMILREIICRLNDRVQDLEDLPTDLISVRMLTNLTKELRNGIKDLAELEGQFRASPLIQLNQITIQYEHLTSFLFTQLCPECKLKLSSHLTNLEAMR